MAAVAAAHFSTSVVYLRGLTDIPGKGQHLRFEKAEQQMFTNIDLLEMFDDGVINVNNRMQTCKCTKLQTFIIRHGSPYVFRLK